MPTKLITAVADNGLPVVGLPGPVPWYASIADCKTMQITANTVVTEHTTPPNLVIKSKIHTCTRS